MKVHEPKFSRRSFLLAGTTSPFPFFCAGAAASSPSTKVIPLGIVTYNIARDWDLSTLIGNLRRVGIGAVELRTTHRHGVEPDMTKAQRELVRKKFQQSGIVLWGLGTTCEFHSPNPQVVKKNIETCRLFCELARDVGAKGVKVRPNGLPPGVPKSKTLRQIGESLSKCGKIGESYGVEIWCEVHGRGTSEPANMAKIMQYCNHPNVGITWNCNRQDVKNGSVKESFELLGGWIRSVHLHELYDSYYPYKEFFNLLKKRGYKGFCLAEIAQSSDPIRVLFYYKALYYELQL